MPSSGEKAGQVLREFMKARDPTKTIFKMMGTFLDGHLITSGYV